MTKQAENPEFYLKKESYLSRKFDKISRKMRARYFALEGQFNGDYSSQTININWDEQPTRFDLINTLVAKHNYKKYVEIGCSTDACFKAIATEDKIGVDPFMGGTHRMTSDEFFAQNNDKFDIIFIDGLHQYEQVKRDMLNAVAALNDNGVIIVHDCLPKNYYAQLPFPSGGDWNGDVWKAFVEMRTLAHIDCAVCLIDHGLGIIKKRRSNNPLQLDTKDFLSLKFKDFMANHRIWLNVKSYDEALEFINL